MSDFGYEDLDPATDDVDTATHDDLSDDLSDDLHDTTDDYHADDAVAMDDDPAPTPEPAIEPADASSTEPLFGSAAGYTDDFDHDPVDYSQSFHGYYDDRTGDEVTPG